MTLPALGYRSPPTAAVGEDPVDNERRSRAELERVLTVVDSALRQAERRIADLEQRLAAAGIP